MRSFFVFSLYAAAAGASAQSNPNAEGKEQSLPNVVVTAPKPWMVNVETKRAHLLPEVNGTTITVTKKNSVEKLDEEPAIADGNLRKLFDRLPGVLIAEQQNPARFNMNYRGIGNPQEAEFVLSLRDGIPIVSDWIGFPTLYYLPAPQSIESIQLIRGGSSLLYGPQPGPVINYVSRRPDPNKAIAGRSEFVFGSRNFFGTYQEIAGTSGAWEYMVDVNHRHGNGQRVNSGYNLTQGDIHLGYKINASHKLNFDLQTYSSNNGIAGNLTYAQYSANPDLTPAPYNRLWLDRTTAILSYEGKPDDKTLVTAKLWNGYQRETQRSAANFVPPQAPPATTVMDEQRYHYTGVDTRVRHDWGRGNAFTGGFVYYMSDSPWAQNNNPNLQAERGDLSGTPRLRQERSTRYAAVFAENVFRFGKFHIVPSARFEHEEVDINEAVKPVASPLVKQKYVRDVPLLGLGFGHDFGVGHESYVNISQGYRPLRYLDVASPFSALAASNNPNPSTSMSYEAGVHGWPQKGFYYDVGVFQVDFKNRIESLRLNATDVVNVNSGDTRHRGIEAEVSWDMLAAAAEGKGTDKGGEHLTLFGNASLLDAVFTRSNDPAKLGKRPAFAPNYILRAGLTWSKDKRFKLSLSGTSVARQFIQDNNLPSGDIPAEIPQYTLWDLTGEYAINDTFKILGGINNLTDKQYYSRVFSGIEPANRRSAYVGVSVGF